MLRSLASALLVVGTAAGCTLWPGQPWGQAEITLASSFSPEAGRLTDDGWVKTSGDYAYRLEGVTVSVTGFELVVADDEGGQPLAFDPASPPTGYSLCHQGHCHSDDGALVPYEEISAEVTGAQRTPVQVMSGGVYSLGLEDDPASVCEERAAGSSCELPRGTLSSAIVQVGSLSAERVSIRDERTGDAQRLTGRIEAPLIVGGPVRLRAELGEALDGSEAPGVALDAVIEIAPDLLDRLDFADVASVDDFLQLVLDDQDTLIENFAASELRVQASRFELPGQDPVLIPGDAP
jgi:hypothetical protein